MTVGMGGGVALLSLIMRKDVNLGRRGSGPLPPLWPSLALWLFLQLPHWTYPSVAYSLNVG